MNERNDKMKYKTNGNISPHGIPKVYFTGHLKDCKVYFENISNTMFYLVTFLSIREI